VTSPLGPLGSESGGDPKTSARVLSDVRSIQKNGIIISSPPTMSVT
jgi:hypothetical protein